jgi:glycosyltransferase involved in cell wall biosynthesis
VLPEAVERAMVLGGVLDGLGPDVVHVHDVYMMHVAAGYAGRAARLGRVVRLVYDAREFVPGLAHVAPLRVAAYARLEAEFIRDFDRVVTVSEGLAELLVERHGLLRFPDIVLNGPIIDPEPVGGVVSVREVVGLGGDVPLLVYGGVVNPARGLGTVVEALSDDRLVGVHLVLVVNNRGPAVRGLLELANRVGVADRVHLVDYVAPGLITRYIASADIGLSPLSRAVNHDVALTNKFCEYIVAGLPIVTSDTPTQAGLVDQLGLGAVYRADDPNDCARAIHQTLNQLPQLRTRLATDPNLRHQFTWNTQAETLRRIYTEQTTHLKPTNPTPATPTKPARSGDQT